MTYLEPALRGLRWQFTVDRIDLVELERRIDDVVRREAREPLPSELVAVWRDGKRCPFVRAWAAAN